MDAVKILAAALREWKCPSCGGVGLYHQRGVGYPSEGMMVPCSKCDGGGIHPTARKALREAGIRD